MSTVDAHVVAQAVIGVRTRLRAVWPLDVDDVRALVIGVCGTLTKSKDTIELACERRLAPLVVQNLANLSINPAELLVILKTASTRGVALGALDAMEWFGAQRDAARRALSCTIAEASGAALWAKPAVQLATVIAFQASTEVVALFDAIYGAVVRSDVRRVEDLHFECLCRAPDPNALLAALELVAGCVL